MGELENKDEKIYDVQSVKNRLVNFVEAEKQIRFHIERLENLQDEMSSIKSPVVSDMPRNPNPSNNRIADSVEKKMELEERINELIRKHKEERKYLESIIYRLKKSDEQKVIFLRYIDCEVKQKEWSDICFEFYGDEIGYYEKQQSHMRRLVSLHGRALLNMAKIIEEMQICKQDQ